MDSKELLEDLTSRNLERIYWASYFIVSDCNNMEEIQPLLQDLPEIRKKSRGLKFEDKTAPDSMYYRRAKYILNFYNRGEACPCALYLYPKYLGYDHKMEAKKGFINIIGKISYKDLVQCNRCGQKYSVFEKAYHSTTWHWEKVIEPARDIRLFEK
ncbi:MAG: hypothetical protein JXR53_10395 [Bacteroidales bacterium]|nr:hypothetical protein [Bacteroidales bacterium]